MYERVADYVYLVLSVLLITLSAFKLRAWQRQPAPALLVMAVTALVSAVSFLCSAPTVTDVINEGSGISFLSLLIVYVSRLLFGAGAITLVLLWAPPSRRPGRREAWAVPFDTVRTSVWRRVVWVYGAIVAAILLLFATFPSGMDSSESLDTNYANEPSVLVYLVIYQAGFAWALWQLGRTSWRHAADLVDDEVLRRNLRRQTIGCALIGGYCITKIVAIVGAAADQHALDWMGSVVGPVSGCVGCVVLVVGWAGAAVTAWRQRRADYRALHPLWMAAMQVDGRLALGAPLRSWAEWLATRDLEWRITRRTREIRDGQLALRPWVAEGVVEVARRRAAEQDRLEPQERAAAVAAAAFAGGVRALHARQRPAQYCEHTPGTEVAPRDERRHLVLVARHLHGDFVAEVLAETQ
ncbi:MAB_1171c family putative transporter [Streptomyces sp. NPDC021622]|uniref:MAB_1171c family putative transporter n=1 Tax=Streptomyces sp. NPDC021622 TaxID=3155013 RepID=UPI0033D0C11E